MSSPETTPPCRLLVRSKKGVQLFTLPSSSPSATADKKESHPYLLEGATSLQQVSPTGLEAFFHLAGKGVVKCDLTLTKKDTNNATAPFLENSLKVQMLDISPSGTYLLTWERWSAEEPDNLKIWSAASGAFLAGFSQKGLRRDAWPNLQWTPDEKYAFLQTTNEVRVYPAAEIINNNQNKAPTTPRFTGKFRVTGIQSMSLPRTVKTDAVNSSYLFTSFMPGSKDKPARASLYQYIPGKEATAALMSKSLFLAEECKTHWSPAGDAALISLQTSVDTSGQSYYGSNQLFLLAPKFSGQDDVMAVPLPQEGPVLDVAWMPEKNKPACFVVVAGKMPSMASLHHGMTGEATFLFGNAHRNTISWSPHGRFLAIAGFGNLSGLISFWDRNKTKLIPHNPSNMAGTLRAEAAVCYGWSPDSRMYFVATCSPRMNVDNGIRLYHYTGEEQLDSLPWDNADYRPDQLLECSFVVPTAGDTAATVVYPDRPQSPVPERPNNAATSAVSTASAKRAGLAATRTAYVPPSARGGGGGAKKTVGAYQPPSARGGGGGGTSLAERMRREKESQMQGATKVVAGSKTVRNAATGKVIPGLSTGDAPKSKSAIKREKAKLKKKQEQQKAAAAQAAAPAPEPAAAVDPEKRARKIKKTLKQIDDLKKKDASALNEDQKTKMASEESLLAELAQLGIS